MKMIFKYAKTTAIIGVVLSILSFKKGEPERNNIYKKYVIADTTIHFKHALLVLYTDNTYINFGIIKADFNEVYVWYSSGLWIYKQNGISFRKDDGLFDLELLKRDIKKYYRKTPNRYFLKQNFQFVSDNSYERVFHYRNAGLFDPRINMNYKEINSLKK